jgi:hypothetical protein
MESNSSLGVACCGKRVDTWERRHSRGVQAVFAHLRRCCSQTRAISARRRSTVAASAESGREPSKPVVTASVTNVLFVPVETPDFGKCEAAGRASPAANCCRSRRGP